MSNPISTGGFQTGRRWLMWVAMLAIGAMLLAACGGDDEDDEDPTPPPATEAAEETSPTAAAEASPAASPMGATPIGSPAASPIGSPMASPMGSPIASPETDMVASPAASPVASPAASPGASPAAMGNEITITMGMPTELEFDPSEVTIAANTDVTVNLPNEGAQPHNFSIDELNISIDANVGEAPTTTINAPPGEYEFYCNIPGHREGGMVGTLIVQ